MMLMRDLGWNNCKETSGCKIKGCWMRQIDKSTTCQRLRSWKTQSIQRTLLICCWIVYTVNVANFVIWQSTQIYLDICSIS